MINKQRQTHGPLPKVFNYYLIIYLEYAPSGQNTWSQPAQKARALSLRPKWLPPRKWWSPCCPTYFQAAAPPGPWTEDGRSVPERRPSCALSFAGSLDIRPSACLFVLLPAVRSAATQDLFPVHRSVSGALPRRARSSVTTHDY
jgi:hypothetical protein